LPLLVKYFVKLEAASTALNHIFLLIKTTSNSLHLCIATLQRDFVKIKATVGDFRGDEFSVMIVATITILSGIFFRLPTNIRCENLFCL
jgi:hypothetical protein